MPYSEIIDGKVLDYHFIPMVKLDGYNFKIGDILIGQIFKIRNRRWSAVPWYGTNSMSADGFATRLDAAEYCLKFFREQNSEI